MPSRKNAVMEENFENNLAVDELELKISEGEDEDGQMELDKDHKEETSQPQKKQQKRTLTKKAKTSLGRVKKTRTSIGSSKKKRTSIVSSKKIRTSIGSSKKIRTSIGSLKKIRTSIGSSKKIWSSNGKATNKRETAKGAIGKQTKKLGKEHVKIARAGSTTYDMVLAALSSNVNRKGASLDAIKKYYISNFPDKEWTRVKNLVKKAILRGLGESIILRAKNSEEAVGVTGRFKINKELFNTTAKKVGPATASQKKMKVTKTMMKMQKVEPVVEKDKKTVARSKPMKIDKGKKEKKAQGKENNMPKEKRKPSKKKFDGNVETANKKFKATPAKMMGAKNQKQDMKEAKPPKESKSAPAKKSSLKKV